MNEQKLNLAFIGGGINSAIGTTHKIASQMDDRFRLVAGCFSRNTEINKATAKRWHVKNLYTSYKELIEHEKENIDALVILTPTHSHAAIIKDLLPYNIPIICEKTLTSSLQEALELHNFMQNKNLFLLTTYNYTGYPMLRELKAMIHSNKLGKVNQIHIQMPQESFIRLDQNGEVAQPQAWRLEDKEISTLSLDLGTHLTNMVSFLTAQKPLELVAMQNSFGHHKVIDNLICMLRYTNNVDCQMWYSKSALGYKNGLTVEVFGTKGSAKWYQMNPEFLEFNDNFGRNITLDRASQDISVANQERYNRFKSGHPAGFIEAFANHYDDIYEALLAYKQKKESFFNHYVFDIHDSINGLRIMQAIQDSIKTKKWELV